jgi:hypothetical protein
VLLYGVGGEFVIAQQTDKISNLRVGDLLKWQISEEWQDALAKAITKYLYAFSRNLSTFSAGLLLG